MSKFKTEAPFTEFRGKICKHTQIIYKKLGQTNYTSQICNPRTKPYAATEIAVQDKFKQAHTATLAVLQDPAQRATATTEFRAQKKYTTLRGYIFAREYKKL